MDVTSISLGGPVLIGAIWAIVQLVKKRIPDFNPDWCWVLACAIGIGFSMVGAISNPTPIGLEKALEQGLLLGVAAVGLHNAGQKIPPVLVDILQYLNIQNFGTTINVPIAAGLPPDPPVEAPVAVTPGPTGSAVPPTPIPPVGGPPNVA